MAAVAFSHYCLDYTDLVLMRRFQNYINNLSRFSFCQMLFTRPICLCQPPSLGPRGLRLVGAGRRVTSLSAGSAGTRRGTNGNMETCGVPAP